MKKVILLFITITLVFSLFPIDSTQNIAIAQGEDETLKGELSDLFKDEILDKDALELLQAEEE